MHVFLKIEVFKRKRTVRASNDLLAITSGGTENACDNNILLNQQAGINYTQNNKTRQKI